MRKSYFALKFEMTINKVWTQHLYILCYNGRLTLHVLNKRSFCRVFKIVKSLQVKDINSVLTSFQIAKIKSRRNLDTRLALYSVELVYKKVIASIFWNECKFYDPRPTIKSSTLAQCKNWWRSVFVNIESLQFVQVKPLLAVSASDTCVNYTIWMEFLQN